MSARQLSERASKRNRLVKALVATQIVLDGVRQLDVVTRGARHDMDVNVLLPGG